MALATGAGADGRLSGSQEELELRVLGRSEWTLSDLSCLRLATTTFGSQRTTTTTRTVSSPTATVLAEGTATTLATWSIIWPRSASARPTSPIEVAAISISARTSFFDKDLFTPNVVGVGRYTGVVGASIDELYECAILWTADIEVGQLAEATQRSLQDGSIYFVRNILDIAQNVLLVTRH